MKKILLFFMVCLLMSCATDKAFRYYLTDRYPPKQFEEVQVLYQKPDRDFLVMADLQARGVSVKTLRKEAAKIGADAIIVAVVGEFYSRTEEWAELNKYKDVRGPSSRITVTAIKYK